MTKPGGSPLQSMHCSISLRIILELLIKKEEKVDFIGKGESYFIVRKYCGSKT